MDLHDDLTSVFLAKPLTSEDLLEAIAVLLREPS
jgi:hypothetical protein